MKQLIEILFVVKSKFTDDSDLLWTSYETAKEVRDELDGCIKQLEKGELFCLDDLNLHFSPTSTFQEHSMQNGWTNEYLELSERFDGIYTKLKGA